MEKVSWILPFSLDNKYQGWTIKYEDDDSEEEYETINIVKDFGVE